MILQGTVFWGGVVAEITRNASILDCYSTGQVNGNSNVGGFIGSIDSLNTVSVTNSYWDTETSGIDSSAAGEGRTTAEMTYPYSANTYDNWDFIDIWREDVNFSNNGYPYLIWTETGIEVSDDDILIAKDFELYQNYPNPFNPTTEIKFALSENSQVKLSVYNISGQKVADLYNGTRNAGIHKINFDGSNLNSGVYYYTLEVNNQRLTRKMLLTK